MVEVEDATGAWDRGFEESRFGAGALVEGEVRWSWASGEKR